MTTDPILRNEYRLYRQLEKEVKGIECIKKSQTMTM
jgi:hypothetical protein